MLISYHEAIESRKLQTIRIRPISTSTIGYDRSSTSQPNTNYLDKNSISEPPKYSSQATHKAWVKMVVHKDLIQDGLAVGDYQMILNFAHCEDKTLGLKSITSYTKLKNGLWNNNSITVPSVEMDYVVPSSIGEGILNTICS